MPLKESMPIIFIHRKNPLFLLTVLLQARLSNPNSKIYLIGDKTNNHFDFITHYNYEDLIDEDYNRFVQIYEHMSSNTYEYELFCFLRWFLLKNLIKKENITQCFHADSDVMIYKKIDEVLEPYKESDLAISEISGHYCYIKNYNSINDFCNFMLNMYEDKKNLETLKTIYSNFKPDSGGICDMTMFSLYYEKNKDKIANLRETNSQIFFDHQVNMAEGFELKNNRKNLKIKKNKVICRHLETNKDIEFAFVHFQGQSKGKIKKHFLYGPIKLICSQIKYNKAIIFKELKNKFEKIKNKFFFK